jgi:hypothetical protein
MVKYTTLPLVASVTDDKDSDSDDDGHESIFSVLEREHPELPPGFVKMTPEQQQECNVVPDDQAASEDADVQTDTPQAELLAWHYRLGHLPFERIKSMAAQGDLPKNFSCVGPRNAQHACFARPPREPGEPGHW